MYGSGGNRRTPGEYLALSNIQGIGGSILPMSSHGLVPPTLFYVLVFYMTDLRLDLLDIMEVQ